MEWTTADLRTVSITTVINGLWLGILAWLLLGLWLNLVGFVPCWLGATLVSWPVAILRVGRAIGVREEILEEMRSEGESPR
jgi:hypothetical protein